MSFLSGAVFNFHGGLTAGFAALIVTGLSWSLVGVIMGSAPRRGIDTSYVQFCGALVSLLVSVVVLCFLQNPFSGGSWLEINCYFFTGLINFVMLQFMAEAMKRGPNGVIWGMIQSGTMWPFIMGVVFFGVVPTPARLTGMAMLIAALFLFGSVKSASGSGKYWVTLALIAFCCCGFQQCITSIPSYLPASRNFSTVIRSMLVSAGIICGAVVRNAVLIKLKKIRFNAAQFRMPVLWGYVAVLQGFGLFAAYFLTYNGMDTLAAAGMGAISYPLMVASCIVGFSLYSILWLREKNRWPQYLALVMCLAGIICLCAG